MAKGGNFEREISTLLSIHWSKGKRDDIFWHTGGSGARATSRFKRGKETSNEVGDIGYKDAIGKPLIDIFNIELKTGYRKKRINKKNGIIKETNFCVLDCIDSNNTKNDVLFKEFWKESVVDSERSNRIPLLIFRRTQKKAIITMYTYIFHKCIDLFGIPSFSYVELSDHEGDYTSIEINNFLKWADLKQLVENIKWGE